METERIGTDVTRDRVFAAVAGLDGASLRVALERCIEDHGIDATVADVVVPVLREVGVAWRTGRLGVVHEHFASSAFRGVLGQLRARTGRGRARTAVLACPPHELHDLPLELFGAMLGDRNWRVVVLGANTPMAALGEAVHFLRADACVLAAVRPSAFQSRMPSLSRLAATTPVFLAGAGSAALAAPPPGTIVLPEDLRAAADVVDRVESRVDGMEPAGRGLRGIP